MSAKIQTPPGSEVVAGALLFLDREVPIQRWRNADRLREKVKLTLKAMAGRYKSPAIPAGTSPAEAVQIKRLHKEIRKSWDRTTEQARRLSEQIAKRLEKEQTRDSMQMHLRAWADRVNEGQMGTPLAAEVLLKSIGGEGDYLKTPSDITTRGILSAVERGKHSKDQGETWPTAHFEGTTREGKETVVYKGRHIIAPHDWGVAMEGLMPAPEFEKSLIEAMERYASSLGDYDSDILQILMSHYAEKARGMTDIVVIKLSDMMEMLPFKKHVGGSGGGFYRDEDKRMIRERVMALRNSALTVEKAFKGKGNRRDSMTSPVLHIEDFIGQKTINGWAEEWHSISYRLGRSYSANLFTDSGRLTANIQAQALKYNPVKELYEKRILKWLGFGWRMNRGNNTKQHAVSMWLQDAAGDERFALGADLSKIERRDAERLESAFDRLRADGHIHAWRYDDMAPSIKDEDRLRAGWLDRWLEREIIVEAPEHLMSAMRLDRRPEPAAPAIAATKAAPSQAQKTNIADRFRAYRASLGVSQLKAAEAVGIHNTILSRLERGKQTPTPDQEAAMEAWLREMKNRPEVRESVSAGRG